MSRIHIHGVGVVSPAGWGMDAFRRAVWEGQPVPLSQVQRPDGARLPVRRVPVPTARPSWAMHPRLRRASPIAHHAVAAALEALGAPSLGAGFPGLGIVACVMGGSVLYSGRFFGEALQQPSTASPLLFPETVFNAPASHLSAVLGTSARNDTCVADETGFLTGLTVAAEWLETHQVDQALVIAAEEIDWTTAEAGHLYTRSGVLAEGAAAVLLSREPSPIELAVVASPQHYLRGRCRDDAFREVRRQLGEADIALLANAPATEDGIHMPSALGNGLAAWGGWTCIAAIDAIQRGPVQRSVACVAGSNLQALGVTFARTEFADRTGSASGCGP